MFSAYIMDICKIAVFVPEEFSEKLMDSITEVIETPYDNYERAFSISKVTGTWRPIGNARPFKGTVGKIEESEELRIEFIVLKKDLAATVRTICKIHPYEEPAIDIIEMTDWHSVI